MSGDDHTGAFCSPSSSILATAEELSALINNINLLQVTEGLSTQAVVQYMEQFWQKTLETHMFLGGV